MDRNEIYTGKARLVNRGNGIVLRCATKGELAALLSLLRALFPHGGRMKDLMAVSYTHLTLPTKLEV